MDKPNYEDFFPEEGWICPYCVAEQNEEEHCLIDRADMPRHLIFSHEYPQDTITWEYIYNRLMAIGGV